MEETGERLQDDESSASLIVTRILHCKQQCSEEKVDGVRVEEGEKESLFLFCQIFQNERKFSSLPYHPLISELLQWIMKNRICQEWLGPSRERDEDWLGPSRERDEEHIRCVLMTLRLLLRDNEHQEIVRKEKECLKCLEECFTSFTDAYITSGEYQKLNSLKELSNIFQKIFSSNELLSGCTSEVAVSMVRLLSQRDSTIIQCCLCSLINICKSDGGVDVISTLHLLPPLLHLIQFSDLVSRQKAADLLFLLVSLSLSSREEMRDVDGLPFCLRLLHSEDLHVLQRMVSVIEKLCEDRDTQEDLRLLGGVPLLLSLIRKYSDAMKEGEVAGLKAAVCSTVTQLATNDTISLQLTQENGVHILSKLILPVVNGEHRTLTERVQRYAWRALRYLYSSERNRKKFRKLFPPRLFEAFIDMGHYVRDTAAYSSLIKIVNNMTEVELESLRLAVEEVSDSHSPLFSVGGYEVHELLGSGAFGNVYRVKKTNSETFLAMKEIKSNVSLLLGSTANERTESIGQIMNEVNIIKEQLHHPNIVLYHKCFEEGGHLYIVMELIEGSTLNDVIASLVDKNKRFEEKRMWQLFTQLTLGLRYLHKEKHIIHRDLKPSNLMVSHRNKLTITDFGLAKQKKREFSFMESTVGTISYWSPELVRNENYTEKADIWAAGCVLYQMATLQPPFHTTNILSLAKKIAEVEYPAVPGGHYSPLLTTIVGRCLTALERDRADSLELGSLLTPLIMADNDRLAAATDQLQLRLDRERQRTLRHRQRYRNLKSLATPTGHETTPTTTTRLVQRRERFVRHPPIITSPLSPYPPSSSSSPTSTKTTPTRPHPPLDAIGMECESHCSPVLFHKDMELGQKWDSKGRDCDNVFPETPLHGNRHGNAFSESMTSSLGAVRGKPSPSKVSRGRSYSAVVPTTYNQRHHSGRGHGTVRSLSTTAANWESGWSQQGVGVAKDLGSPRMILRTHSASSSSLLSLSSRHVREISDPITDLLTTLHRLLSLTLSITSSSSSSSSLPPHSARLLVLDRYQRSLFHSDMTPDQIKGELHRLGSRSDEGVWLLEEGVWSVGPRLLMKAINEISVESSTLTPHGSNELCTLTYDLLATMIDSLYRELKK